MREIIERYLDNTTERELAIILWFIRGMKE